MKKWVTNELLTWGGERQEGSGKTASQPPADSPAASPGREARQAQGRAAEIR